MAFLILTPNRNAEVWKTECHRVDPEIDIRIWPDIGHPDEIDFILSWNHPAGEFKRFKNLKCIASLGAGVDHILKDPEIPRDIYITRVVDPLLAQSMAEYVTMAILINYRLYDRFRFNQQKKIWKPEPAGWISDFEVGIMGMGEMGLAVAKKLNGLGFRVSGWCEPGPTIKGIQYFFGEGQLHLFLRRVKFLVCLLPLTEKTKNILNRDTFAQLPEGAYVINVARGGHLVEEDLLQALDGGNLSGACLDVFRQEPLPLDHPFWSHPKITVTPHIASITNPQSVAKQIVDNYHRLQQGKSLRYLIDRKKGY